MHTYIDLVGHLKLRHKYDVSHYTDFNNTDDDIGNYSVLILFSETNNVKEYGRLLNFISSIKSIITREINSVEHKQYILVFLYISYIY